MNAFRLYSPLWLLMIPTIAVALWWTYRHRRPAAAIFSSVADLRKLPVTFAQRVKRTLPYVYVLGLALMIVALARPQLGKDESKISTEGIAIQVTVDLSGSMRAMDFDLDERAVTRIAAVKHVLQLFIEGEKDSKLIGRPNDLIGLVSFGGFADSRCPLTLDHGSLVDIVKSLEVPKEVWDRSHRVVLNQEELATAIGDALSLSLVRINEVEAKSKIIVLMTDGDNTAGKEKPLEVAKAAKALGIKVYTIGVGRTGYAPIEADDGFEKRLIQQQFRMDEKMLLEIADMTGGKYFNAQSTSALEDVYREIDTLERSKVEEATYTEYTELYPWAALPGIALVLLVGGLSLTRFRTLP